MKNYKIIKSMSVENNLVAFYQECERVLFRERT